MSVIRIVGWWVLAIVCLSSASWAQQFDEQFDLWPVQLKLNGTVILGGGGQLPEDAVKLFLATASQEDAGAVAILFADNASTPELDDSLQALDMRQVVVAGSDNLSADDVQAIESAEAIWFDGPKANETGRIGECERIFSAAIRAVENGAMVCANGSIGEFLGKYQASSLADPPVIVESSELIPDVVISTAYSDAEDRNRLLASLALHPRCVGIGIEENTAIVLRKRKIRVVGDGSATFCLMANEQKPLRIQHLKQPKSRRSNPYESIVDLTAWRRDAIERTVEPFPPQVPPEPNVAEGTLIIVGGGGMPRGLMEKMVALAGGPEARMVYVPCSERDEIKGSQRTVETWKKMGVKSATFIHTKDRIKANSDEEFLAPLRDATGIWFGGGRQWNFSDSYYGTRAHKLMKDVLSRGGVIGGSSAGASIQARYMCRANPVANFDIMAPGYERGLGFIGGVAIDQHFSQRGRQKDMTQLVDRYPQLLGIGIDESTAIIVADSRAEVVGKGNVHFYDRNQPVEPGKDDFLALPEGSVFDLAKREIIEGPPENTGETDED